MGNYDAILNICVLLTNLHIRNNALRYNKGKFLRKYKTGLLEIGFESAEKRRIVQQRYREKDVITWMFHVTSDYLSFQKTYLH